MTTQPTIPRLSTVRVTEYEAFELRLIAALGATVGGNTLSRALGWLLRSRAQATGSFPLAGGAA